MSFWDNEGFIGDIDLSVHTGLLLAEDAALKGYLSGLTVPGKDGPVTVEVYFRYPEGERRIKYPFITIDFLGIEPNYGLWRSVHNLDTEGLYVPSTSTSIPPITVGRENTHNQVMLSYQPFLLTYQVVVHCRSALHDRFLASRFMGDVFPPRSFFIGVDADNTWRRCELISMQPADYSETTESGNKRVFRKVYTITMLAEIPVSRIQEVESVHRVHVDVYSDVTPATVEDTGHSFDDPHSYAEPFTVEPPPGT
jgi:hypothetical protein